MHCNDKSPKFWTNRVYRSVQGVDLIQQSLKQIQKLEVVHFSSVYNYLCLYGAFPMATGFITRQMSSLVQAPTTIHHDIGIQHSSSLVFSKTWFTGGPQCSAACRIHEYLDLLWHSSWHREPARSQLTRNTTTSPQEKLPQQSNAEGLFFLLTTALLICTLHSSSVLSSCIMVRAPQLLRSMKGSRCWVDIWVAGSWLPLALAARGRRASLARFKWLNGVLAPHRCFAQPLSACVS